MLHYDIHGVNFYDFLLQRKSENENYIDLMVNKILFDFVNPMSVILSDYFNIAGIKSMGDIEMILNRMRNIF
ncbi:hypothetical protein BK126_04640 [Paenibacillus sp. FSL H7-0326]|nr:hypothetical protein BK126_04640 [Paenibacillus sp. FSL H7-0326]